MDDIIQKIASTAIHFEDKDASKTMFKDLYKNREKSNNQEERRKKMLEVQKCNRNATTDTFRGILDIVNSVDTTEDYFGSTTQTYYRPNIYVAGFVKAPSSYYNVLMISEWMVEKPSDFAQNWYVVPCPKGSRVLIVANNGRTKLYNKYGRFRLDTKTLLPGGHPNKGYQKTDCCVLDGFYDSLSNSVYILDLLAWNNQAMTDGETDFRHFWLQTQVFIIQGLNVLSKVNKLKFFLLPKVPCSREELNQFMMTYPAFENYIPALDGLLFYHKKTHYISGQTPLVGWLYPFMVKEVLGYDITVHESYNLERPEDYTNQADYIVRFEERKTRTKQSKLDRLRITQMQIGDYESGETYYSRLYNMDVGDCNNEEPTSHE
ncbi:snurportin-1 [Bombyx mori]|uniref:Snurportin-1 n=1 Tax=Bombyx mori TaxID=7091 RepID=A0A8R1WQ11_BOMMO|nr:snurportin-1 [Bombyx mori]